MQPVTRKSKSRTRTKRSHHALKPLHLISCPNCGRAKKPHGACTECGYVNSHTRIDVAGKSA